MNDINEKPKKSGGEILGEKVAEVTTSRWENLSKGLVLRPMKMLVVEQTAPTPEEAKRVLEGISECGAAMAAEVENERLRGEFRTRMYRPEHPPPSFIDEFMQCNPAVEEAMQNLIFNPRFEDAVVRKSPAIVELSMTYGLSVDHKFSVMEEEDFLGFPRGSDPAHARYNLETDLAINLSLSEFLTAPMILDKFDNDHFQPSRAAFAKAQKIEAGVPIDTCGFSKEHGFSWNSNSVDALDAKARRFIVLHERMHLQFARLSPDQKIRAELRLNEMEKYIDNLDLKHAAEMKSKMAVSVAKVAKATSSRVEAPCKQCSRNNDIGSKKCWWCETSDPVC